MISSLGLIEIVGLVGAIEAGDTAVKAANVRLIGLELTKGGGMVTVKIEGEVSAVTAAVEAGARAAEKLGTVISKLIIARPSIEVSKMIENEDTEKENIEIVGEAAPKEIQENSLENIEEEKLKIEQEMDREVINKKNRKKQIS